ncbi:glycine/betaine ABC transporter substrate-binding protein [Virgibacillus sp. NKC19-3]|uniref:glycine betaine ABC transporter substrate-binding protein n=1 Tax=Virgibacillus saliphilus TaxID=2831674 RepID=UPI001C9B7312|nr:glycine betaine ABC transporter substrate-binding protein [Virgibacillus sp. NKC19-3]MBY7144383.1 glycine/betaine ABC transporter substrate-binding protein [Virgibacillus sp. NKC19-3]
MKKMVVGIVFACLVLLLAACGNQTSEEGGEIFNYGAQKNTDAKIMGQIVTMMMEDQTIHEVEMTEDLPASPQVMSAIDQEELDFATLYSGEVYNNHFDEEQVEYSTDGEKTIEQAQELFGETYDIKWYDSIGFRNQYSIAISNNLAKEKNIEMMSDLEPYAGNLILGTDNSWIERANDGYDAYQETYGYSFSEANGMDVALMYEGINSGELDAVTAYTVDPQILEYDLQLLEDDMQFFPPYDASIVARNDVIDAYPEVSEVLDSTVGMVSTEEMMELMHEVDIKDRGTKEVAKEFLQEKGLLE